MSIDFTDVGKSGLMIQYEDIVSATGYNLITYMKSKGYKNGQGGRGDLIVEVKIMVPKQLTNEEKKLFEKLDEISKFNPRLN